MIDHRKRAILSFTGGKDCHLAFYEAKTSYNVCLLVTFVPSTGFEGFKAHPIKMIEKQAEALGIPHR